VTVKAPDSASLITELKQRYRLEAKAEGGEISFVVSGGKEWLPQFVRSCSQPLQSLSVRSPTLDDVFLKVTGHAIREQGADQFAIARQFRRRR